MFSIGKELSFVKSDIAEGLEDKVNQDLLKYRYYF